MVATLSFIGGRSLAGAFGFLAAIIVSTQIWRGKLSHDLARSELAKNEQCDQTS